MKYTWLILCLPLIGCDAIRSTTDRVFGGSEPPPQDAPEVVEAATDEPEPAVAVGWVGPKRTIASLGDPSTPGRWLRTPLVEAEINGRVVVPRTGAQAYITLVPTPGPEGGGSQLSLDAMRELLVPFDELVELDVYSN